MTSLTYDLERVLENLYDDLARVQDNRNMVGSVFVRQIDSFFGPDIADGYRDWMDIDDD